MSNDPQAGQPNMLGAHTVSVPVSFFSDQIRESMRWRELVESERIQAAREREQVGRERRSYQRWTLILRSIFFGGPFLLGALWLLFGVWKTGGFSFGPLQNVVGVVQISGEIKSTGLGSASKIVPALEKAFSSDQTKAVILQINSPGGLPLESERINASIASLKAKHKKPVIAVIENVGASAAYLVAMHADEVYAGRYSLVGSVGAVMAGWDVHRAMEKLHIGQRVYTSGSLKSMLNPFAPQTPAADAKAQSLVSAMGSAFVRELRAARGAHLKDDVDYGTGEVWYGEQAKEIGLVDDLLTIEQVIDRRFQGLAVHQFGPRKSSTSLLADAAADSAASAVDHLLSRSWSEVR